MTSFRLECFVVPFFLRIFASQNINIVMNGDNSERLPQEGECRNEEEYGILTTACKSVQLLRLKKWAQEQGYWFEDRSQFGDFFDRGSENEVYLSSEGTDIIKLNDFRYSDDNLTSFFERIKAHNKYFDACAYRMIGLGENSDGKVCAVLAQRFVHSVRIATTQEIHDEFIRIGFHPEDNGEYYTNGQHDIFDAVDGNVLIGDDGHVYFIDTIIYPSNTGGYETYCSLSPRHSSSSQT